MNHTGKGGSHWIGRNVYHSKTELTAMISERKLNGPERNTFNLSNSCNYLDLWIISLSLSERQENRLELDVGYSQAAVCQL